MEDPNKPDINAGGTPEGTDSLEEAQKKLEEKKAQREGLEKALEEEEILIAEHEERVRAAREKKRELEETAERKPPVAPSAPTQPAASDLIREVRREILSETRTGNLKEAKRAFYKTAEGKLYDPLNDPSGRKWKELEDFLHLTDSDVSVESVLRKLKGAALAHGQENYFASDEQRKRNEEEARRAAEDLGSGGRSSGERPGMAAPPAGKPTKEDEEAANRLGVKLDSYMRAKQKVLLRKR